MTGGHEKFKEQLPALALGALSPGERGDLEHHLESCAECRAELAWLEPATEILATEVEDVEPSPDLRERVMATVEADLATGPAAEAEQPPERTRAGGAGANKRSRWAGQKGRLGMLFRPAVVGAVAAALFAGIATGVLLSGGDGPSGPDRQVITGRSTIGADAVMVASDGTGTLKLAKLKRPGEGRVYQAWVQRGQSVEPTDSLFVPRRDGTATASIPDLAGVSAVMVSAEPSGGSDQPTTAPVIVIELPG